MELQLDLLEAPAVVNAASSQVKPTAGQPLMLAVSNLYADPNNPRADIPQAELDELTEDIRERGVLQPIVVSAPDEDGRCRIQFGSKRWRAAIHAGLDEVPVVLATRVHDAYDQVAENLKRHGMSPLDLARFIRGRVDAGESNAEIARRLVIDQTTVAHHLALLDLPPVLDVALKTGRCKSPRTLYELSKLNVEQPECVAELLAGGQPITREAVARVRDAASAASGEMRPSKVTESRPDRTARTLTRMTGLCERLDLALLRLTKTAIGDIPADELLVLHERVTAIAGRLEHFAKTGIEVPSETHLT